MRSQGQDQRVQGRPGPYGPARDHHCRRVSRPPAQGDRPGGHADLDGGPGNPMCGSTTRTSISLKDSTTLRPGLSAEIMIDIESRHKVTRVPIESIRWVGGRSFVALHDRSDKQATEDSWRWQPIEIGLSDPDYAEVLNGLKAGRPDRRPSWQSSASRSGEPQEVLESGRQSVLKTWRLSGQPLEGTDRGPLPGFQLTPFGAGFRAPKGRRGLLGRPSPVMVDSPSVHEPDSNSPSKTGNTCDSRNLKGRRRLQDRKSAVGNEVGHLPLVARNRQVIPDPFLCRFPSRLSRRKGLPVPFRVLQVALDTCH